MKHKEIIDKENISPIKYCQNPKNGQKNGKMVKNQPPPLWFLKKSTTNNNNIGNNVRNNNINNNNYSGINSNKSMLKSEENSFAFLTEEEKMLNTRKKLEEDLKKSMMDYESNSKTVQTHREYLLKKQKSILSELERTNQALSSTPMPIKPIDPHVLLTENAKVQSYLMKNSQRNQKISIFFGFFTEKTRIIERIYQEESNKLQNKERINMLKEEFMSSQVQMVELAFEFEELDSLLENYQTLHPIEYNEAINEVEYDDKSKNLTGEIAKTKANIEVLGGNKEIIERKIEELKVQMGGIDGKLVGLRGVKQGFKRKETDIYERKEKILGGFDQIGREAIGVYLEVFEEREIENKEMLFKIQNLILEEFEHFCQILDNKTCENKEEKTVFEGKIQMKKRELIEQNGSDGNLKQILTVLVMNEQLFWNVVSGMRNDIETNTLQVGLLFKDLKELSQGYYGALNDLQRFSGEYKRVSSEFLEKSALLSQISKDLSNELKSLASLKCELKFFEQTKKSRVSQTEQHLIKGTGEMISEFLKTRQEDLKDLKFKYGKEYAKKLQIGLETEFLGKNREESKKLKLKIKKNLTRKEAIKLVRSQILKKIENQLENEKATLEEEMEEIGTKITGLKMKLAEVVKREKGFIKENEGLEELRGVIGENLRNCEDLAASAEFQNREMGLLLRQGLFEEKKESLELDLENLRQKEFKDLEEKEIKLKRLTESIEEKKERLKILLDYMRKKGLNVEPEKEKVKKRHGSSKSFIGGGGSAKFGLVTIELKK